MLRNSREDNYLTHFVHRGIYRGEQTQQHQRNQLQRNRQQHGLTAARIQKFKQFPADESLVGDKCSVCQDEIEVGRRMMRLDCDGQHAFCQGCVEGWFADHKTCPNCRHEF